MTKTNKKESMDLEKDSKKKLTIGCLKVVLACIINFVLSLWYVYNLIRYKDDLKYLACLVFPFIILTENSYICVVKKGKYFKWYFCLQRLI